MWYDKRLRFNLSSLEEFSLNWLFLEKVWTPDTYIVNGVSGTKLHSITVPNKFVRLRNDGFLMYSMR
jgi:gamma-aminobutyric acid receptor subunit alpha